MSEVVGEFVNATHKLRQIRKEHAPAIKAHMAVKKAAQLALYNHMDTRNVTCVAVSEGPLAGQFVRMKTNRSTRAITDEVIHVALHAVPDDVLTGNSLDEAVDLILTEVQRARTVQRKYVAFDTSAERGCEKVESPSIAEHATAYAQATDGLKAARAELNVAIGDRPAQLREHEAATAAWMGDDKTPVHINLNRDKYFVRQKESKRKPRVTAQVIGDVARKALGRARKHAGSVGDLRATLAQDILRRLASLPREVVKRVTLDRKPNL